MTNVLIVCGTFDNAGGKPSGLMDNLISNIRNDIEFIVTSINGGFVEDLHTEVLPSVVDFDIVLWFANVANDEVKSRDVKAINPKAILITSKRNDNEKYSFAELISRALAIKANLTVEFSKRGTAFNMMLFDPLGNVFYDGFDVVELCKNLINRAKQLLSFTRVPTIKEQVSSVPAVPNEKEFFSFAHDCADIFHNLIRPAKGTDRFLGNMSFRCQNGFPSFKGDNGVIYVSRRNVDKSGIDATSFVPTYLDTDNQVKYFGDSKPSVDTPIQLRLYKLFPWAKYMIHAHCYVDTSSIKESLMFSTVNPIPCGALEEVNEISELYAMYSAKLWDPYCMFTPRLLAINLAGHGCILIANDIDILKELQKHRNNCFISRPMPEKFNI